MHMTGRVASPVDQQPCRVARFDRCLGDALCRQVVVEIGEAHGATRLRPGPWSCDTIARMTTLRTEKVTCGSDGSMDLHIWAPDAPPRSAILLIQEIFGVSAYIRDVADELAGAGYLVGAPDVFWRFAPNWEADHDQAGLAASLEKVQQLDFPNAVADCSAALAPISTASQASRPHRR